METVIVDAGPLVAYLRHGDADHAWTVERFKELRSPRAHVRCRTERSFLSLA